MDAHLNNAGGGVNTGLEHVLLDDDTHPFVATINMSEFELKFSVLKEIKYAKQVFTDRRTIPFADIVSIQHISNTSKTYRADDVKTLTFELCNAHFTRIFLRCTGSGDANSVESMDLITCGYSRLHMQVMSLWHAQRLRASLCIDDRHGHSDIALAEEYYTETLASLREVAKMKSPLADQVEILHEFADEVVSDVELKEICFKSKELFMVLFKMYATVLEPPDHKMIHMKNKALVMTDISSKTKADIEIEEIIFKKLLLFHAIIRVCHGAG
jgi:hypothetical protein